MRKRLITPTPENIRTRGEGWLDVELAAVVEVTSEDKDFPVEAAFVSGDERGWRAAAPGSQTIRLIFDQPQALRSISLVFEERDPAHARVRSVVVSGWREIAQRNCASVKLVATVCLFLFAAQAVAAQQPLENSQTKYVIERLDLVGNRSIRTEMILARISSRPGKPYSVAVARRDVRNLWNMQLFDDVRLEIEDSPDLPNGKIVVFIVQERPIISRIEYKGIKSITESDILNAFKKESVGLSAGSLFDRAMLKHAVVVISELLAAHGHQFAAVKPSYETNPSSNTVTLVFNIDEEPTTTTANGQNESSVASKINEVLNVKKAAGTFVGAIESGRVPIVPSERRILVGTWKSPEVDGISETVQVSIYEVESPAEAAVWLKPVGSGQVADGWKVSSYRIGDEGYLANYRDGNRFEIQFRSGNFVGKIAGDELSRVREFAQYIVVQIPAK